MPHPTTTSFLLRCFIQIVALWLLNWGLHTLMPVVVETLMKGMHSWNAVGVVYCWGVQVGFLMVSFSLRNHLSERAKHWFHGIPRRVQKGVVLLAVVGVIWVMVGAVQMFLAKVVGYNFLTLGELLLLTTQIYWLAGIAAPMGGYRVIIEPSYRL